MAYKSGVIPNGNVKAVKGVKPVTGKPSFAKGDKYDGPENQVGKKLRRK
jgi:hypothetical protein